MRSVTNIQEENSDYSPIKEREKERIKENTDFGPSSLRLKVIGRDSKEAARAKDMTTKRAPAGASDSNARFINIQTKGNHPLGKFSSGHDDHGTNTHETCKRETDVKTKLTDYSLTPPELTDSEGEYDSESETGDNMLAVHHPSGNIASVTPESNRSDGYYLPERPHVSKMIIKDNPVSDIDVKSSDEEREKPRVNKEMNKNTFHRKRLTNLCHPPGRYSPVIKTQQHTDASKEKGRIMVRKEGSSDNMLDSSLTGRTNNEVN